MEGERSGDFAPAQPLFAHSIAARDAISAALRYNSARLAEGANPNASEIETHTMALRIASFLSALLLLIFSATAAAESEKVEANDAAEESGFRPRTLLQSSGKPSRWRGFSSPMIRASSLDGDRAFFIGGRGAAVFDHTFAIGGGGYTLLGGRDDASLSYGGPAVNIFFFPEKLVHFDLGLMTAWGRSRIGNAPSSGIFVLEPEVNVELNVAKSFRIALGASYRYVARSGSVTTAAPGLGGIAGTFALRFGSL